MSTNKLSLSNSLMITVGVVCVETGSDEIYENLVVTSEIFTNRIEFSCIFDGDIGLPNQVASMISEMHQ